MAIQPVFLDTLAILALIDKKDRWHGAAAVVSSELEAQKRPLVVTEWVLTEFLNATAKAPYRQLAVKAIHYFRTFPRAEIVAASHDDWLLGFALYESRMDKEWSLVDCLSIHICQQRGIEEVFTADHHFEQAGLRILLTRST
jgi:hypothetical protein